jgi:hypothetical protein
MIVFPIQDSGCSAQRNEFARQAAEVFLRRALFRLHLAAEPGANLVGGDRGREGPGDFLPRDFL